MFGIGDRRDGAPVADTARPAGDLRDVEHRVSALDQLDSSVFGGVFGGVTDLEHTAVRPQHQVRDTDIETTVQLGLTASDRVDPAERDREAPDRFPLEVIVELTVVIAVQADAVATFGGSTHHRPLAEPTQCAQRRRGRWHAKYRVSVEVQPRAVENQPRHVLGCGRCAAAPIQPERDHQAARRVSVDQQLRVALRSDGIQRPF